MINWTALKSCLLTCTYYFYPFLSELLKWAVDENSNYSPLSWAIHCSANFTGWDYANIVTIPHHTLIQYFLRNEWNENLLFRILVSIKASTWSRNLILTYLTYKWRDSVCTQSLLIKSFRREREREEEE